MTIDMDEMKIEAGKRLMLVRKAMGYETVVDFAEEFSFGYDALSSYENGLRTIPWPLLRELKEKRAISTDWLIHGDESGMPSGLMKRAYEIQATPGWDIPARGPRSKGRSKRNDIAPRG